MPDKIQIDQAPLQPTHHLSAHELVKKQVEHLDFHVTDEDLQNIDTTVEISAKESEDSIKKADKLENNRPQNPYETLGE